MCQRHQCKIILTDVIIFCSVMTETKQDYIFQSTRYNLLLQVLKCPLFKEKNSSMFSQCPNHTFWDNSMRKSFFFVHHPRIISRCLSSSVLLRNKQSVAPGNIGSKLGQVPNSIVTINHSLTHLNDIHGFLCEVTATKMEKLPSFIYTPTSNPVNEYKHFLLYDFPVFHFQGF